MQAQTWCIKKEFKPHSAGPAQNPFWAEARVFILFILFYFLLSEAVLEYMLHMNEKIYTVVRLPAPVVFYLSRLVVHLPT